MFHFKSFSDQQLDNIIAFILRTGVILSALTVLAGGILYLYHYGSVQPDYKFFHEESADLRSITGIVNDSLSFSPLGIIQMGLLILIATPICRVVFAFIAFTLQKDRVYMLVTLIVFGVLLLSLTEGNR